MAERSQNTTDSLKIRRQIFMIWLVFLVLSMTVLFLFDKYSPRMMKLLESRNPRIFVDNANRLMEEKKYEEALAQVNEAIQVFPSDFNNYLLAGDIYDRMGNAEQAITEYEKAMKMAPNDFNAYFRIGVIKQKQNKFEEALGLLKKAAELNTVDRWVYNALAWSAYHSNQLDLAYDSWQKAIQIAPKDTIFYFPLALVHTKRQAWAQAAEIYDKIISLDSTQTLAYDLGADALLHAGNIEQAEKKWNFVLQREPKSASAFRGLGEIQMQKKQWSKALSYLEQANSIQPNNPDILNDLVTVYQNLGNKTKATQIEQQLNKLIHAKSSS